MGQLHCHSKPPKLRSHYHDIPAPRTSPHRLQAHHPAQLLSRKHLPPMMPLYHNIEGIYSRYRPTQGYCSSKVFRLGIYSGSWASYVYCTIWKTSDTHIRYGDGIACTLSSNILITSNMTELGSLLILVTSTWIGSKPPCVFVGPSCLTPNHTCH